MFNVNVFKLLGMYVTPIHKKKKKIYFINVFKIILLSGLLS